MKRIGSQPDGSEFFVRYLASHGVSASVQAAGYAQALGRRRGRDQAHDGLIVAQRFAAPVRGDERKQPMLHLVPFAGARRKVAHHDGKPRALRQFLQLHLPLAQPIAVTAAAIRRDQQFPAIRIQPPSLDAPPPRIDATAKAPVSWSVPTFTNPVLRPRS